jgi:release factor glutamine methyltransferase
MRVGQEIQTLPRSARLRLEQRLQSGVTRMAALKALRAMLADAGIGDSAADARLLLCAAGGIDRLDLIREPELAVSATTIERLLPMVRRRAAGEPVSRILSRKEFWGLSLAISPAVLDPRPDTETLVGAVLKELAAKPATSLRILDLGAGSGAILCALLRELPKATGVAVDLSSAAAAQARANLAACGLAGRSSVIVGSWGRALAGSFEIIVSNPPYIATSSIAGLEREVRDHDPALALDGGPDGLDAYRAIAPQLPRLLTPDGRFFLEVGAGQAAGVMSILALHGLTKMGTDVDLAGFARVVRGAGAPRGGRPERRARELMEAP